MVIINTIVIIPITPVKTEEISPTNRARYEDDGHAHCVLVEGKTAWLSSYILHDDRKSLSRWLSSQDRYTLQEVKKLRQTPRERLDLADLMRRSKVLAPIVSLFYCLIIQRGMLDGWAGWYYALQRVLAETLLAIRLVEDEQLNSTSSNASGYLQPLHDLKKSPGDSSTPN